MMKFESYPFLEIARTHGVDYGHVLIYAEMCGVNDAARKNGTAVVWPPGAHEAIERLPSRVCGLIRNMMSKPVHERRGTPR